MNKETNIIICGDICPTVDTLSQFENGDEVNLFNDLLPEFKKADLLFGNLEFVLTDNPVGIKKSGPILTGKQKYIEVLKKAGFNLLSLANNHIKDCGEEGVKNTISVLDEYKIPHLGAGKNIREAKKPFIKEINGHKIAFMAFAEQEFNVASETEYGANYFDPYDDLELITKIKQEVDFLFVIYHGGIEYYEYPSPLLQKKCRKFIDVGADLVTCQHSHCIGTFEKYNDKDIVYGQGNTLFGYRNGNDSWNRGIILKVAISNESKLVLNPIFVTATTIGIELLDESSSMNMKNKLEIKNKKIKDREFLQKEWDLFCKKKESLYYSWFYGFNRILIHVNRLSRNLVVNVFYSKSKKSISHNLIRCEAHNEVIQNILRNSLKK